MPRKEKTTIAPKRSKEQLAIDLVEWNELYEYVFKEILGYEKGMKLPKYMILRLRGLRDGQFLSNKKTSQNADYSFKIILYTFKAKKLDIIAICGKIEFKDEIHKFNTIMKVIENSINDIVLRINKVKDSNNNLDRVKIDDLQLIASTPLNTEENSETVTNNKPKNKMAEKFKDLW